mmetsp:Transcript_14456/g.54667  ORF Transcript_14456/g.54667 Transcript_14456/m.54667 type:complete len:200 (+) Transcript_14456:410-1009(+)
MTLADVLVRAGQPEVWEVATAAMMAEPRSIPLADATMRAVAPDDMAAELRSRPMPPDAEPGTTVAEVETRVQSRAPWSCRACRSMVTASPGANASVSSAVALGTKRQVQLSDALDGEPASSAPAPSMSSSVNLKLADVLRDSDTGAWAGASTESRVRRPAERGTATVKMPEALTRSSSGPREVPTAGPTPTAVTLSRYL